VCCGVLLSVLQCVAVHSRCVAGCCSVLQCAEVGVLRCVAGVLRVCSRVLRCVALFQERRFLMLALQVCCSVLQVCCSVLQCIAAVQERPFRMPAHWHECLHTLCCIVSQGVAECCSVLQCVGVGVLLCAAVFCGCVAVCVGSSRTPFSNTHTPQVVLPYVAVCCNVLLCVAVCRGSAQTTLSNTHPPETLTCVLKCVCLYGCVYMYGRIYVRVLIHIHV